MNIAFLLHPLNLEDFELKVKKAYFPSSIFWGPFLKLIPSFYIKNLFSFLPPHKVFDVKCIQSKMGIQISCSIIVLPLFSEQIVSQGDRVVKPKLLKCAKIAQKHGAKIMALGAFTSIVCDQGRGIAEEAGIAVTSGNTLTAALTIDGIIKSAKLLNKNFEHSTLAIIGATGDIGLACARVLINKFNQVILCSRSINQKNSLVNELIVSKAKNCKLDTDVNSAVKDADFVILATSAFGPIVDIGNLKKDSIICDVSLPYNISNTAIRQRRDIFVFEGGKAKLPFPEKIMNTKWHSLMPNNSIFGCLAEAIVLGFEDRCINYSLGRGVITDEKINEIRSLSKKHGVELADFSYQGQIKKI